MKIIFPEKAIIKPQYYNSHYKFILNIFKYMNINIEYCSPTAISANKFTIKIDNQEMLIDFSDHIKLAKQYEKYKYYFKYHYTENIHEKYSNVYPLGSISFLNWEQYFKLKKQIKYKCNNDIILNNQRIFGRAIERRKKVRRILKKNYGNKVDNYLTDQKTYWNKINNCLVGVFVPGARPNMLDRAQLQFMAFGACTISPKLVTILANYNKIESGIHYIECKLDYSDLTEKIQWCKTHRRKCIEIGKNAQKLFIRSCVPKEIWKWIKKCLKN